MHSGEKEIIVFSREVEKSAIEIRKILGYISIT